MKKNTCGYFGLISIFAFLVIGIAGIAQAEVNLNINFGPPPITVSAPPEIIMIPGSTIYYVPNNTYDIFFSDGYWWSPSGDRWYRARQYNGPWGIVKRNYVPQRVIRVPKNYREVYKNERPINYGQWKKQGPNKGGHGNKH